MRFYPDMVSPRKQSKVAVDLNPFLVLKVQPKTKVKLVCHQIGSVTVGVPPPPPTHPLFPPFWLMQVTFWGPRNNVGLGMVGLQD